MKGKFGKRFTEHRKVLRAGCGLVAAAVLLSGSFYIYDTRGAVAELPVIVDGMDVVIEDEQVPLASAPKKKTEKIKPTTKTTKKKVKMKKAAKKTYSKVVSKKTTNDSKVTNYTDRKVTTKTKVTTTVTEKYKKKSKTKTVITKVKTEGTIVTEWKSGSSSSGKSSGFATADELVTTETSDAPVKKTLPVATTIAKADANVRDAFIKMGFTIQVDSSVGYTGKFNAQARTITMRKENDDAVYHELGHFLMFLYMGNAENDGGIKGRNAYAAEKGLYSGFNQAYVAQNASEYMAESYYDYCMNNAKLKATRPQTYALIEEAVSRVDDTLVARYQKLYASVWK